jgi:hypothetical protein
MYADLDSVVAAVEQPLVEQGITITHKGFVQAGCEYLVSCLFHAPSGQHDESYFPLPRIGESRGASTKVDKYGETKTTLLWVSPQDIGGAMTYGKRYNLVALLNLQTEADDDGNASSHREAEPEAPKTFVATEVERERMTYLLQLLKEKEKPIVQQSLLRKALMRKGVQYDDSRREFTGLTEDVYAAVAVEMQKLKEEALKK